MFELDTLDLELVQELRKDCRLSLRDLGSKVGLSAPAVAARLKRLEESGVIQGYTVSLAHTAFALNLEAVIQLTVPEVKHEAFVAFMRDCLCVSSCLRLTGEYSHQLTAGFDNMQELSLFISRLNREYGPTRTSLVLQHEIPSRSVLNLKMLQAK